MLLGVESQTVHAWESGRRNPSRPVRRLIQFMAALMRHPESFATCANNATASEWWITTMGKAISGSMQQRKQPPMSNWQAIELVTHFATARQS